MPDSAGRATIHEVSRVAGVSISSVSRALNGQTRNAELIQRVHRAVEEVGYSPSAVAQSLRQQRVGQIALAVEDIGNPAYLAMVRAIQPVLRLAGIRLVLHSTDGIVQEEIEVVQGLRSKMVDGLIICPIRPSEELLEAMSNAAAPVVVIGKLPRSVPLDNVAGDSRDGARMAAEHLVAQGCRRIALVTGPNDTIPSSARLAGYLDVLEPLALVDRELIEEAPSFSFADGHAATNRLLDRTNFDALLGVTDRLALGGLHALRDRGLTCPDDVRIVGVDDSEVAVTSTPPLTSVNLGALDRGRIAAELMLSRLQSPDLAPRTVIVDATLSVRESSR